MSGAVGDYDTEALFSSGNQFNDNSYKALSGDETHWAWGEEVQHRARYRTWPEMREFGQELDGRLDVQFSKSLDQNCGDMAVGPAVRGTVE